MDLNDLKSEWQNANSALKSENELHKMLKITNHPSLKKIRTKLIIETIAMILFLSIYYDWFDGDKKSFWVNALLVSSVILYILNDVIGYIAIIRPSQGVNLKLSMQNYLVRIKRLSFISLIVVFLYNLSFIIFFSSVINFNREKNLILLFIIVILFQMMYLSSRIWTKWIKNLELQVKEFDLKDEI